MMSSLSPSSMKWMCRHYGVLLLYGQHLAINHLVARGQTRVVVGHNLLDQSTTDDTVPYVKSGVRLNLHCWHTDLRFSKFYFKANRYNDSELIQYVNDTTARAYVSVTSDEDAAIQLRSEMNCF